MVLRAAGTAHGTIGTESQLVERRAERGTDLPTPWGGTRTVAWAGLLSLASSVALYTPARAWVALGGTALLLAREGPLPS